MSGTVKIQHILISLRIVLISSIWNYESIFKRKNHLRSKPNWIQWEQDTNVKFTLLLEEIVTLWPLSQLKGISDVDTTHRTWIQDPHGLYYGGDIYQITLIVSQYSISTVQLSTGDVSQSRRYLMIKHKAVMCIGSSHDTKFCWHEYRRKWIYF